MRVAYGTCDLALLVAVFTTPLVQQRCVGRVEAIESVFEQRLQSRKGDNTVGITHGAKDPISVHNEAGTSGTQPRVASLAYTRNLFAWLFARVTVVELLLHLTKSYNLTLMYFLKAKWKNETVMMMILI